jgi:hypothetical protein
LCAKLGFPQRQYKTDPDLHLFTCENLSSLSLVE